MSRRPPRHVALLLAVIAGCALRPAAPSIPPTWVEAPSLQRLVDPRPDGAGHEWLGGDVASSTPLGEDRYAWIFGDTLLGRLRRPCPPPARYCGRDVADDPDDAMIANSVGIMRRSSTGFHPLETFWRSVGSAPAAAFAAERPGEFLWPLALARIGPALLIATSVHARATGLYSLGSVLVRVANPDDDPARWRYTRHPLPHALAAGPGRPQLSWATALVPDGRHVLVVGEHGTGPGSHTVLARLDANRVAEAAWRPAPEYLLVREGGLAWERAFDERRLHHLPGLPGISETTFHRAGGGRWHTYRVPPGTFEIRRYSARAMAGPWRDDGVVYRIPAPWSTARNADGSSRFQAYAAKAHPELGTPDRPGLTYNVNVTDGRLESAVSEAERLPEFYVPRVLAAP